MELLLREQIDLLKQIALNTRPKESFQVVINGTKTKINTRFTPAIELNKDKKYEIALVNLETYYSFPNITSENNQFRYSPDGGISWRDITIPTGSISLENINKYIQKQMKANGHYNSLDDTYFLSIEAYINNVDSLLTLLNSYRVDFTSANSIGKLFGFNEEIYTEVENISEQIVDILSINSVLVTLNIIKNSYLNGPQHPVIYSFFPKDPPGYKIIETPHNLVYLPITVDTINNISISLIDQDLELLDLRGERLTIRFHIKEI